MRKLNKCFTILFVMTGFMLTSCSSDSGETAGESTGDYWPSKVGNQWIFDQDGSESTIKILSSSNKDGNTYYKFNQLFGGNDEISGTAGASLKKVKGDYYVSIDEVTYDAEGITGKMTGYEFIFFKDYLEVNQTWTGSYSQETTFNIANFPAIKMTVNYTGTILEKGTSIKVKEVTYDNVVKFKFHLDASMQGQTSSSDSYYWIAKDVGIVKFETSGSTSELVSYSVK
ncbi:TapB family protein [Flavobacterium ginsenosidimutans]|uniref:DUF3108 domain-containing protein n=1 Tax=Flavobacterium ginsenosidimutans TaxID=687844 RepID=A0ABZ2Q7C5_9FLAO|nr:hypothetical protein [Flavobacterium ginsenosidimutans]KAF2336811.1 hypothetical protein DM444_03525 [Flavobacterium ginsenosidimutans]